MLNNPGEKLRSLVISEQPLVIVGVVSAFFALLAKSQGIKAIYLSGAGVSNMNFGLPDLGMTSLTEVCEQTRRITEIVDIPLLVDGDTGWGGKLNVARTVTQLINSGAGGVHLEDQQWPKRCGHLAGKKLVSTIEMMDKIKMAVDSRHIDEFVIMARTDAKAVEGLDYAIERAQKYVESGADMIFAEALESLDEYEKFTSCLSVPVLANITEFGKTPIFTKKQLSSAGVSIVLYPLTIFRLIAKAATSGYSHLANNESQENLLPQMQTRKELYNILKYDEYDRLLD